MDRLLQLLIDFKTPLDRSGKNIDDYLSALFEKYIENLRMACDVQFNSILGENTCSLISSRISDIECLCEKIVNTIRCCESGRYTEGKKQLFDALEQIKDDLVIQYSGAHRWETYYRVRAREKESDFDSTRKELFHVPYDKREYASSMRFSVKGYPCSYLSSQYEMCWAECHKPLKFALAAFDVPQTRDNMVKLIDIAEAMIPLAHSFFCWFYNENELDKIRRYLEKQLVTYPLRTACSVMVTNHTSSARPEYIIPQILMQWLLTSDQFDGVRYETAVDYSEMRAAGGHNISFVTKDFDADGYTKNLRSNIKVGTPIWVKIDEINIIDGRNPEENPYLGVLDIPMDFKLI